MEYLQGRCHDSLQDAEEYIPVDLPDASDGVTLSESYVENVQCIDSGVPGSDKVYFKKGELVYVDGAIVLDYHVDVSEGDKNFTITVNSFSGKVRGLAGN